MNRKCILIFLCFSFCLAHFRCFSQENSQISKQLIDSSVYPKWPFVSDASISNDGEYVSYILNNVPAGSMEMVIKSSHGNWEMRIEGVRNIEFTSDSRLALYKRLDDSLFVVKLGGSIVAGFSHVSLFKVPKEMKNKYITIYRNNGDANELLLFDYLTNKTRSFADVKNFLLSEKTNTLLVVQDLLESNKKKQFLNYVKLDNSLAKNVWRGSNLVSMTLDDNESQLVFIVTDTLKDEVRTSCLYYKLGEDYSKFLFNDESLSGVDRMEIKYLSGFNGDNSSILFNAEKKTDETLVNIKNSVNVRIWSYLDKELQSLQEKRDKGKFSFLYSFNLKSHHFFVLNKEGDMMFKQIKKDKGLVVHVDPDADMTEHSWNKVAKYTSYLVSATNGERIPLEGLNQRWGNLSNGERFVIYNDRRNYFCYDVVSGEYKNLTKDINTNWSMITSGDKDSVPRGIAGWLLNDESVLVYDRYDIWSLDPLGKRPPMNITNGYGRKHNIVFYLAFPKYRDEPISIKAPLIINATGWDTKKNGFFKIDFKKSGDPELLTYGDYAFNLYNNFYATRQGYTPVKARNAEKYIVSRMSATESLNFFLTSDFRKFIPLSSVYPEKSYNWYTTELHSWTTESGVKFQGVLYKPENFDSTKRYPLIFNYYEKRSFNLNVCLIPDYSSSDIDIPTYVSNGYLVFAPDFEYEIGNPMKGTYSAIISAANYLSKLSFVDSSKMGIQGFSMGGVQTYYLVANTNLFAAACAASGQTDFISSYGTISKSGRSLQSLFETGQNRMGGAPWEITEMYIRNSAIFKADKVTTPLLMMHTTDDEICPFSQAIEFYTALRRLGKKVWMLEYTDGHHAIKGTSAIDFDIRMAQFFDHYLMDKPAPKWMTQGVSAKMMGIESGLGLDSSIVQ